MCKALFFPTYFNFFFFKVKKQEKNSYKIEGLIHGSEELPAAGCVPVLRQSGAVLPSDNPLPHRTAKGLSAQSPLSSVSLRYPDLVYWFGHHAGGGRKQQADAMTTAEQVTYSRGEPGRRERAPGVPTGQSCHRTVGGSRPPTASEPRVWCPDSASRLAGGPPRLAGGPGPLGPAEAATEPSPAVNTRTRVPLTPLR